jgi:WD40 repeat protein
VRHDFFCRALPSFAPLETPIRLEAMTGAITFSPDGRLAALCGWGPTRVEDARTGATLCDIVGQPIRGPSSGPATMSVAAFTQDGGTILAADGVALCAWSAATGKKRWSLAFRFAALTVSADDRLVAGLTFDGAVVLVDAATGALLGSLPFDSTGITALAFSPAEDVIAIGRKDGAVDLESTGDFVRRFR